MEASITISRDSHDTVRIELRDRNSRIKFALLELSLENYALAVTGLSEIEGEVSYAGLEFVGKTKVAESRKAQIRADLFGESYSEGFKDKVKEYLIDLHKGEDWMVNSYLNSKDSIVSINDGYLINYSVFKYVE